MILQIILLVTTVSLADERISRGIEFESFQACFEVAAQLMDEASHEFGKLQMKSIAAGCMVRVKDRPA